MKLQFLMYLITFWLEVSGTFFLLEKESIFLCLKVCPLYCLKRQKRDADPPYYWDDDDVIPYHKTRYIDDDVIPYHKSRYIDEEVYYHHPRYVHYKHTTEKPTTTAATTTTEEPSGICMFCTKKCGFP